MAFQSLLVKPFGKRIHHIEFHEEPYCPSFIRRAVQDGLAIGWRTEDGCLVKRSAAKQVANELARVVASTNIYEILDLCSGGGGPIEVIAQAPAMEKCKFILTDLHPNLLAFHRIAKESKGRISFSPNPVDATKCDYGLSENKMYIRTMFGSMHHMQPELLERILRDCVRNKHPFVAIELTNRSILPMVNFPMMLPFLFLLNSGFAISKGQDWLYIVQMLIFTFVIPIIPLVFLCDAITSCLRTYSREEFMEIVKRADPEQKFQWKVTEQLTEGVYIPMTSYVGTPI